MKIKSRTEIKIEKHEIRIVRFNSGKGTIHCRTCGEQTTTLTPEQLASFLRVTVPEICRQIETAEIHLANRERGVGLICAKSLEDKKCIRPRVNKT